MNEPAFFKPHALSKAPIVREGRLIRKFDISNTTENSMAAKKQTEERAVLVTTKHRGVFFGYAADTSGDVITLKRARCCVKWIGTRGFLGLTTEGPNKDCRIGPAADELQLRDITAVALCSPTAVTAWEAAPWSR